MRRASNVTWLVTGVLSVALLVGSAPVVHAVAARQLTTAELRPLVLTTPQARQATGFGGDLSPGTPAAFKCGRQPDNQATFCSRIWNSTSQAAHPTISTVASFASAGKAQAQILDEAGRAKQVGTIVKQSPTYLLYSLEGPPDLGRVAVAQQSVGSTYLYAWCTSAPSGPMSAGATCAADLLKAQGAKAAGH